MEKKLFIVVLLTMLLVSSFSLVGIRKQSVFAADTSPSPVQDPNKAVSSIPECAANNKTIEECPAFLQGKLNDLSGQEQTLKSQIAVMNGQINLTQARIYATEQQITGLTLDIDTANQKITTIQSSLDNLTNVLLGKVIATYEIGTIQPVQMLLTSSTVTDFLQRLNYLKIAQAHDKKLLYDTVQAKNDYQNQKNIYEDKKRQIETLKTQLQTYNNQLDAEKTAKNHLLVETQGSEENYQNLLTKARAELAGFTSFVTAAGGGLITFGTGSNGWYYTQRDPQWGNMLLPGSSSSVFTAGCAVASVAMVCKSYGQNVTPSTIVSNPSNFYYGDLWNWAFSCSGKTTDWFSPSQDSVRSYVNNGTPVILRLISPSISGLHFVVAWKWDGNDFIIHDPYYGPDKRFSDRYSWSQITTAIAIH